MNADDPTALQLARAAPEAEEVDEIDAEERQLEERCDLHGLAEAWSSWCRTRRFYVRPSAPPSVLGRLVTKGNGRDQSDGPNAISSAELMAFHHAVLGQPSEAIDRRVFELHYYWRVRNVKVAAAELGISRQHWYRLVRDFRSRVYAASREILEDNLAASQALPSRDA